MRMMMTTEGRHPRLKMLPVAAADEMFPIEFQIMGHTIDENKKKRLTPEWPSSNGIAYMSCISKMILSRIRLTIN